MSSADLQNFLIREILHISDIETLDKLMKIIKSNKSSYTLSDLEMELFDKSEASLKENGSITNDKVFNTLESWLNK